jgi:hypothetical protein
MPAGAPRFDAGQGWPAAGLMQLNVIPGEIVLMPLRAEAVMEGVMMEPSPAPTAERPAVDATVRFTTANKRALDFMCGVQKAMLEETVFATNEMFDRTRTETHLFSEFISKMAASHSVKDWKTMWEECGQHQIDFFRRDSERLFKHSKRMLETASNLFSSWPES